MLCIFHYNKYVINLTMTINGACNRRTGPGGGTRRLHHKNKGGRNRIDVRGIFKNFARNGTNVIGPNFINANDNEMALAA